MKLPRDLRGQRVVRALKRLGFVEERQEGSHLVRGSLRVTVPAHRVLTPKTKYAGSPRPQTARHVIVLEYAEPQVEFKFAPLSAQALASRH